MFTKNTNMLDYQLLKGECPKAMEKLIEWVRVNLENFQRVMIDQLGTIGGDVTIPPITAEHAEGATKSMLTSYYRTLYDFFDENKIFLTTDYIFEEGFVVAFSGYKSVEGSLSRIDAEILGIKKAFEALETTLN